MGCCWLHVDYKSIYDGENPDFSALLRENRKYNMDVCNVIKPIHTRPRYTLFAIYLLLTNFYPRFSGTSIFSPLVLFHSHVTPSDVDEGKGKVGGIHGHINTNKTKSRREKWVNRDEPTDWTTIAGLAFQLSSTLCKIWRDHCCWYSRSLANSAHASQHFTWMILASLFFRHGWREINKNHRDQKIYMVPSLLILP